MKRDEYIPGFDWIKLAGSTGVVFYHIWQGKRLAVVFDEKWIALFAWVVPLFFMIAGYLMYFSMHRNGNGKTTAISYCKKYFLIYYAVNIVLLPLHYTKVYLDCGIWMYKDFIFVLLTLLLTGYHSPLYQLWFVPPLVYGILTCAWVFEHKKEKNAMGWFSVCVLCNMLVNNLAYLLDVHSVQSVLEWSLWGVGFYDEFNRILQGIVYVYLGMWIAKYPEKSCGRVWLKVGSALLALEVCGLIAFGDWMGGKIQFISGYFIASALFCQLIRLKGQCLRPWHKHIAIFSALNFFLHVTESRALLAMISNDMVRFILVVAINAGLTLLLCRKKGRKSYGY